jgi:hypothetical protein
MCPVVIELSEDGSKTCPVAASRTASMQIRKFRGPFSRAAALAVSKSEKSVNTWFFRGVSPQRTRKLLDSRDGNRAGLLG